VCRGPGKWRCGTRQGDRVRLLLSNAYLPEAESILAALSLDSEVEGLIVGFSDSGANPKAFAVVEVARKVTVVVPTGSLKLVEAQSGTVQSGCALTEGKD
jgi:hypothetical protein